MAQFALRLSRCIIYKLPRAAIKEILRERHAATMGVTTFAAALDSHAIQLDFCRVRALSPH
jgi:hypothetical protein